MYKRHAFLKHVTKTAKGIEKAAAEKPNVKSTNAPKNYIVTLLLREKYIFFEKFESGCAKNPAGRETSRFHTVGDFIKL
jgi:hypothetical protein